MLIYDWYDKTMQCVDLETDFHQFYLKFVIDSHLYTEKVEVETLKYNIRSVRHNWRNLICYDTTKKSKNQKVWDYILHRRIANYFNIYSQILNF